MAYPLVRIAALILAAGVTIPTVLAEPPSKNPVPLSEGKKARRERQEKERAAQEDAAATTASGVQSFRRKQAETAPEEKLTPSERAAAEKAGKEKRDQFMAKFDTNGDGKISPDEWRAADPEGMTFEAHMAERFKSLPEAAKAELTKKWDANGDGRLDEKELSAWRARWQAERMDLLARFDVDKDGKLSDAERKTMAEALKAKREDQREEKQEAKPKAPAGDKK